DYYCATWHSSASALF
nr:immunoglobulin light chain junction region [Macaca mulatta]MOW05146.1 immunoglobulin light chain junction region [Macaca mulatta]MOW06309.1 immunoglobulin light chain junction region [Macaca mulatta]MOW06858.1 immunoglobulin light chain junction region [Macaca mulatta]MOW07397.1 immunoglobulin light chain junction region [Macaca mulatta]